MDIEELVIATLKITEYKEIEFIGQPKLYTCNDDNEPKGLFGEVMSTGELCVCANDNITALLLLFLLKGIFNKGEDKYKWFTNILLKKINPDYDEIKAEDALKIWTDYIKTELSIKQHNITQPIIINGDNHTITLTPSTCDIWTLPRVKRQFSED